MFCALTGRSHIAGCLAIAIPSSRAYPAMPLHHHRVRAAQLAAGLFASFLAACGGDSGTAPGTISVVVSAPSLTVIQGASGTVTVTITRTNLDGAVTVSAEGMPAGVTATVSPSTLSGTATTASVAVAVAASTTPGSYPITIRASASGVGAQSTTYTLTVVAPPDFALTPSASTTSVSSAAAGSATIAISRTGGFSGPVTFAVQSAQAGLSATFVPNPAVGANTSVSISATSAVPLGTYPVIITGNGVGVGDRTTTIAVSVVAPPAFALSATPPALTITAGTSGTSSIAIARSGGFAASVALTFQSAQVGISGTFTPATVTDATSALVVAVAATVPPGTYTGTINGAASGLADRTVSMSITVLDVPRIGLSLSPAALSIAAGSSNTSAVTVVRTNFAGAVSLTASGAPSGVTVAFAPASVTGTASVATVTVGASVVAGTYAIQIGASGTGVTGVTITLSLTVTTSSSLVEYRFCASGVSTGEGSFGAPSWFVFQSGNGPWTRVLPTTVGQLVVYRFTVTGPVGAVAFIDELNAADTPPSMAPRRAAHLASRAAPSAASSAAAAWVTTFRYGTREELVSLGAASGCGSFGQSKSHTGAVTGLQANTFGRVWLGGGSSSTANPNYSIGVPTTGPQTLLARRLNISSALADRLILRRGVNQADNSVLPLLDFAGDSSFAPLERAVTIANALGDDVDVRANLLTAPAALGAPIENGMSSTATARTYRTVPLDRRVAGEVDELFVRATRSLAVGAVATDSEERSTYFVPTEQGAAAAVTLGPRLVTPTITAITGVASFAFPRLNGNIPIEYGQNTRVIVSSRTSPVEYHVKFSDAYRTAVGTGNAYEFTHPDFRSLPGFITASMLQRGVVTISTFSEGWSGGLPGSPILGRVYRRVDRSQDAAF